MIAFQRVKKWNAITVEISGFRVQALLDSGSEVSCLSLSAYENWVEKFGYLKEKANNCRDVNNSVVDVLFQVWIPVVIEGSVMNIPFRVLGKSPANMIIGNNVLDLCDMLGRQKLLLMPAGGGTRIKVPMKKWEKALEHPTATANENGICVFLDPGDWRDEPPLFVAVTGELDDERAAMARANEGVLNDILEQRLIGISDEELKRTTKDQWAKLVTVVRAHPVLFNNTFKAGSLKVKEQKIELSNPEDYHRPRASRIKPLSHAELKVVQKWIQDSLKQGIIRPSKSPWRSCVFPVKKDDLMVNGKLEPQYRVVTPYFNINKIVNVRATPVPNVKDIKAAVAGSKYFSAIDLKSAFFQVPIDDESKKLTAFASTGTDLYEYTCIPMGCSVSAAILQSAMIEVVGEMYFSGVIVYIDDLLVYSSGSEEDHMKLLAKVLTRLQDYDARVKPSKVFVAVQKITFLGMDLSSEGWSIADGFIKSIVEAPLPHNLQSLRSFIGLCNWQRVHIWRFSEIMAPLNDLCKKKANISKEWDEAATRAFLRMKKEFSSAPTLAHPDYKKDFTTYSDASDLAIGGLLTQDNGASVIAYFSRKLKKHELNYSIPEKEALALVETIESFRVFVYGYKIHAFVDQKSVEYLMAQEHPSKFARYRSRLSIYGPDIRYIKGCKNPADWFSRFCFPESVEKVCAQAEEEEVDNELDFLELVQGEQTSDPLMLKLHEASREKQNKFHFSNIIFNTEDFKEESGTWMYLNRIYIPEKLQRMVTHRTHFDDITTKHQGIVRTLAFLRLRYFWPKMQQMVTSCINDCALCTKNKLLRIRPSLKQLAIPKRKFDAFHMDLWGDQALPRVGAQRALLVVTDRLTGWVECLPINSKSSKNIWETLFYEVFCRYGLPVSIHSDFEGVFRQGEMQERCREFGISHTTSAAYDKQQNGQAERYNKYFVEQLRIAFEENGGRKEEWPTMARTITMRYNQGWNPSIKTSPYFAVFGKHPHSQYEEKINSGQVQAKDLELVEASVRKYRAKIREESLSRSRETGRITVGDLVWWIPNDRQARKLDLFEGPYEVVEKLASNVFNIQELEFGNIHKASLRHLRICS